MVLLDWIRNALCLRFPIFFFFLFFLQITVQPSEILPPEAHIHALKGDVAKLEEELNSTYDDSQKILTQRDDQGWQILHQGVVSGKKEVRCILFRSLFSLEECMVDPTQPLTGGTKILWCKINTGLLTIFRFISFLFATCFQKMILGHFGVHWSLFISIGGRGFIIAGNPLRSGCGHSSVGKVVELLVHRGAEINARTHGGYGETPLRIAEKEWGSNHPIVHYLTSLGALSLGPEL